MSNPRITKRAKRKWKTLKKMLERFRQEKGRDMTMKELANAVNGGR